MLFRGIVSRVWFAFILLFVFIIFLLAGTLSVQLEKIYVSHQAGELKNHGEELAEILSKTHNELEVQKEIAFWGEISNYVITVFDKSGLIKHSSDKKNFPIGKKMLIPQLKEAFEEEKPVVLGYEQYKRINKISILIPHRHSSGELRVVMVQTSAHGLKQMLKAVRYSIIVFVIGAIIITSGLGLILSRWLSKPLIKMKEAANRMASGDFDHFISVKGSKEFSELGKSLNYLSSKLKHALSTLAKTNQELSMVLEGMSNGVISFSREGTLGQTNPQAIHLLPEIFNNNRYLSVEDFPVEIRNGFNKVINTGKSTRFLWDNDGRVLEIKLSPLVNEEGNPVGAVVVLDDITKEYCLDKMRKEFIADVSHELRTPLFLLRGYTEALQDGLDHEAGAREDYLNIIMQEILRMQKLVNDLVTISKNEESVFLNITSISLKDLARDTLNKFKLSAMQKKLKLVLDSSLSKLPPAYADPDRLGQVFFNLIDNACRYIPEGGQIVISGKKVSKEWLEVSICDNGPGIPKEHQSYIWERFYRVDKSRNRAQGGTGLGLAIVKSIIEAHGGRVALKSEQGEGSCFSFTVPAIDLRQVV